MGLRGHAAADAQYPFHSWGAQSQMVQVPSRWDRCGADLQCIRTTTRFSHFSKRAFGFNLTAWRSLSLHFLLFACANITMKTSVCALAICNKNMKHECFGGRGCMQWCSFVCSYFALCHVRDGLKNAWCALVQFVMLSPMRRHWSKRRSSATSLSNS